MKLTRFSVLYALFVFSFILTGCEDFTVKVENSTIKVEFAKTEAVVPEKTKTTSFDHILVLDWAKFYKDEFGLDVTVPPIPEPSPEHWDIFIPTGLTENKAIEACKNNFPVWQYADDLNTAIVHNDRDPKVNSPYFVRFKKTVEADEDLKNLSANDLLAKNVKVVTLLERIILEFAYFKKTGQHLDIDCITLCSGSRDSDGGVPHAYWRGGGFYVGWSYAGRSAPRLRSRTVVSY